MKQATSLTDDQAIFLLQKYGKNDIREEPPTSNVILFLSQLKNPLILVLVVATGLTFAITHYSDSVIILLAILINTVLGYIQEKKAQDNLRALRSLLTPQSKVIRNDMQKTIDSRLLVPGDIVLLTTGDKVPADGELIHSSHLFINESILTGESLPVEKTTSKNNILNLGTIVTSGNAKMKITTTGMNTKLGTIALSLEKTPDRPTPLQVQLTKLAKTLTLVVIFASLTLFILGVFEGIPTKVMLTTSIAIAVSAIPEGLVVSLTVLLAFGMQRILKRKALVKKLITAETLGSVTTLCIDKTGTLTEGIMQVSKHTLNDHNLALQIAVLANNLEDPIEIALWQWAQGENGFDPQKIVDTHTRVDELPFGSTHKYMAISTHEGLLVKGAPEVLLERSNETNRNKKRWQKVMDDYAQEGLRTIAIGWKKGNRISAVDANVQNLYFIGIFGVSDPLRLNVKESIKECKAAGIHIKVITGDYRLTAESIMRQAGLEIVNPSEEIMEGNVLHEIDSDNFLQRIKHVKLFCRVTPEQKLKIVTTLQQTGEVVAMTGDGVNDALALKKADIGIVVSTASDVAKETADIILLDSNFQTIVAAIEEGRVIYNNLQKIVLYLLSDAFTEILIIFLSIFGGVPLALTAAQILTINILSDGFPNLALTVEPKDHDVMKQIPRPKNTSIINSHIKIFIALLSISKAFLAFALFLLVLKSTQNLKLSSTITFSAIALSSLFYVFSIRNFTKPIWKKSLIKNKWLIGASIMGTIILLITVYVPNASYLFSTHPLTIQHWGVVLVYSLMMLCITEGIKLLLKVIKIHPI